MSEAGPKKTEYSYEKLACLKPNTVVNVYGVVKFVKPPFLTRGSDYCMVISLVDPTLHEDDKKLKCLLFNKSRENLPYAEVGSIVRFHRLKLSVFHDELQGQSGPGFSWLMFSKDQDDAMDPKSQTPNYTFTEADRNIVEALREWVASTDSTTLPLEECPTVSDIVPDMYCNLYCQVVATCSIEENVCFLLRVWDGTRSIYPIRQFDLEREDCVVQMHPSLVKRSSGQTVDIAAYDNHYKNCKGIKPGQYIKVCNLHAPIFRDRETLPQTSELETLELCVHRGTAYGRGVFILPENFPPIKTLSEKLQQVAPSPQKRKNGPTEDGEVSHQGGPSSPKRTRTEQNGSTQNRGNVTSPPANSDDTQNRSATNDEGSQTLTSSNGLVDALTSLSGSANETVRCMLQTKSVVINHPHIDRTRIRDVLQHTVPYKFRILAHVEDFFPRPSEPTDIMRLYCPECHHLQHVPQFTSYRQTRSGNTERRLNGLKIRKEWSFYNEYFCPNCEKDLDCDQELLYTYVLRFRIQDKSGSLIANIWKDDAVTFFNDITPTELLQDEAMFTRIQDQLNSLCEKDENDELPWFECCVKSYTTLDNRTAYQIFDTCLV